MARFIEQVRAVVGGRAVDADAHARAGVDERANRCDAAAEAHVRGRAVGNARLRGADPSDLVRRWMHDVCVPHVRPDPAELFHHLDGPPAEALQAIAFFIERLGQMRVRGDAVTAGQRDALAHEIDRDEKERRGCVDDARHRKPRRVVVTFDGALRLDEDRRLRFAACVGRRGTLRFPKRDRTATGVIAQADLARDLDLILDPAAVRPHVRVVARGRAAREQQFGARDRGRAAHALGRDAAPHRVEHAQPVEQLGILRLRHRAR